MIFCRKKNNLKIMLIILFLSMLLTACNESAAKKLTTEDQKISWSKSRDSGFYNYSFTDLNKEEADDLLVEKLHLSYTETLKKASEVLLEQLATPNEQWVEDTQYAVMSEKNEASYEEFWTFKTNEGYYPMYVKTQTLYTYDEEEEQAYVSRESIEITNATTTGKFNGKDLKKLISQLSGVYNIAEQDFSVKLSEVLQQSDTLTVLYDTLEASETEKAIGKKLYVKRDEAGVVSQVILIMENYSLK
ncbi:hypothetical protein I6N96_14560 [Enterococcus sp. BWM-S5]|uniref:Lipoprotein n=1 Tax=Enterococcus larvae TaxID=2794352 RepID=A0ABS4CLM7_9ENTE|nr:hypothetical protein [Enterococcus larvae]MBP1047505.1 hypothetical protein [Enterococcus larvae]